MVDRKKYGIKRICENCSTKVYDFNKPSPLTCPHCSSNIVIEEEPMLGGIPVQQQTKQEPKDEFAEIENADNSEDSDDEIISLEEAQEEENKS